MTKSQIQINQTYTCKISNKLVTVKVLTADYDRNRYSVMNLQTNRVIILKSGARLRPTSQPKIEKPVNFKLKDLVQDIEISTVLLPSSHYPVKTFETCVFNGLYDGYQKRYETESQARIGHSDTVKMVYSGLGLSQK